MTIPMKAEGLRSADRKDGAMKHLAVTGMASVSSDEGLSVG